ncbi:Na+/melibiose symporter [Alkalibacterium putridalgicola]|uniref:Na+/melibiose symporter n=1 Tax=Alkalibacterium putridalgicola TaxID=426703 RepID=A0A1H7U258_9LACT|nr:MFS transporter [Alkalibacterium putridalgicola]GEK89493.1 sugar transporter [Alkalibacterium putridalgicola]SEL91170.1 Na+/melibiose symporter [Alkalibacterium putridalgicola]
MDVGHRTNEAKGESDMKAVAGKKRNFNRAKIWQIGFFAANNTATNAYMFLMMNVAYFATGVVGLGTVIVSTVITGSRIFDGFTDPVIGMWIDKTSGKFGKFRPFMVGGYLLMTIVMLLLFFTNQLVPDAMKLPYFIGLYALYIIGYTFQTAVTKSGQSVITSDPEQRPIFSTFDISMTSIFFAGIGIYLANYLVPKYGGWNSEALFYEFALTFIVFSGILTTLAVIGIWSKDRPEFFGTGEVVKITFKDMWQILKGNRPLQMLVVAASTDKLGQQVATNSIVMVMLFGIVIGDYGLFGVLSGIMLIPNVIIAIFGTRIAAKFGTKQGYILATWASIAAFVGMFLLIVLGDPGAISMDNWGFMTISFVTLYVVGNGVRTLSGGLVIPMIPDVTDYETYKSGRYAPGVMGTIFSFVDKMISSLAQTVIGFTLAYIGFEQIFPDVDTPYTSEILWVTMFLFIGILLFAWIASLIAMKFYDLDKEKMLMIQNELQDRKDEVLAKKEKAKENQ